MENIKIIDFSQKSEWDEVIGSKAEVYYKWQYVSSFYKHGDGIPFMAYLKGKNGIIYNVYMRRRINEDDNFKSILLKNDYFDIITPYGYGGVAIRGNVSEEEKKAFFDGFHKYCMENNIVSEFIRLNPLTNNYMNYLNEKYDIECRSKTVSIKLNSEQQIWEDLKSTCRNRIRKALNSNLIVKSGFDETMMREFKMIYNETMKRDNATDYYFFGDSFFNDIFENLKNNAIIYTAYLNKKAIDSILVLYSGENSHYHLGGTLSDYMNLGAHNLVLYTAAVDMCRKGYKEFHLGGGYGGDQSPLLRFKRNFNKNGTLDFYIGRKVYCYDIYKNLCDLIDADIESTFFPSYREKIENKVKVKI